MALWTEWSLGRWAGAATGQCQEDGREPEQGEDDAHVDDRQRKEGRRGTV